MPPINWTSDATTGGNEKSAPSRFSNVEKAGGKLATIIACALLNFPESALAVDPKLQFFQYEFGYPPQSADLPYFVRDIEEDQQGFLWLATARGLIQYDGLETNTYRLSDYAGLASNQPTKLFVDSQNRLFVATERGTSVFNGEEFVLLLNGTRDSAQAHAFAEGPSGTVWIGTNEALLRFRDNEISTPPLDTPPTNIRSLLWYGDRLYVGGGTLSVIEDSSITEIRLPSRFSQTEVRDLEMHQGNVWGATNAGLFRIDDQTATAIDRDELRNVSMDVLLSDRDENLWFAGRRFIGRFYPDGRLEVPEIEDTILGYAPEISKLIEDSLGQHWHASRAFGLASLRDTPIKRVSYPEGLPSTDVTALAHNPVGTLFVATDRGISTIAGERVTTILDEDFSRANAVLAMNIDEKGRLWFGTGPALRAITLQGDEWIDTDLGTKFDSVVNSIANGPQDEIWVGTNAGLYRGNDGNFDLISDTSGLAVENLLSTLR